MFITKKLVKRLFCEAWRQQNKKAIPPLSWLSKTILDHQCGAQLNFEDNERQSNILGNTHAS